MLRYLDFPPTPPADATRVSAFDRDQPITSFSIVPISHPDDRDDPSSPYPSPISSSSSSQHNNPLYWQIWLGLPQRNRYVVLDIVRRGMCSGQLVATTSEHSPPSQQHHVCGSPKGAVLPLPFHTKLHIPTRIKDVFKLVYDYAMDCYAFEGTAGRGRRYWISSVLRQCEACDIVVPGTSLEVYNYFAQLAKAEVFSGDCDDDMGGDIGRDRSWSGSDGRGSAKAANRRASRRFPWPIVGGHFLAPREVRPLANVRRSRLPCEIHGTGFRALQYPFNESSDIKYEDGRHSRWSACNTTPMTTAVATASIPLDNTRKHSYDHDHDYVETTNTRYPEKQQSLHHKHHHRPPIPIYNRRISPPPPSPLPLALTSFY